MWKRMGYNLGRGVVGLGKIWEGCGKDHSWCVRTKQTKKELRTKQAKLQNLLVHGDMRKV